MAQLRSEEEVRRAAADDAMRAIYCAYVNGFSSALVGAPVAPYDSEDVNQAWAFAAGAQHASKESPDPPMAFASFVGWVRALTVVSE